MYALQDTSEKSHIELTALYGIDVNNSNKLATPYF